MNNLAPMKNCPGLHMHRLDRVFADQLCDILHALSDLIPSKKSFLIFIFSRCIVC